MENVFHDNRCVVCYLKSFFVRTISVGNEMKSHDRSHGDKTVVLYTKRASKLADERRGLLYSVVLQQNKIAIEATELYDFVAK